MGKRWSWVSQHKNMIALYTSALLLAAVFLGYKLTALTHNRASALEVTFHNQALNVSQILHNPINLPATALHGVANHILPDNLAAWRIASALIAGSAVLMAVYVLRRWYGPRTAAFGLILFATSPWLLHTGRIATPDILLFAAIPMLFAANVLLHDNSEKLYAGVLWLLVHIGLLYVPGLIWFVLCNAWWQRYEVLDIVKAQSQWVKRVTLAFVATIALAPLVLGLVAGNTKSIVLAMLGLPEQLPHLSHVAHRALDSSLFVGIRGTAPDELWLNHVPILSAFWLVAFIAGVYFYAKHWRSGRARLLGLLLVLGLLLSSLGGPVSVGLIVPILYLVAAAGVAYLLHLWLQVFPKNPIARSIGIGMVVIVVAASSLLAVRQYFVAWPHHTDSISKFNKQI